MLRDGSKVTSRAMTPSFGRPRPCGRGGSVVGGTRRASASSRVPRRSRSTCWPDSSLKISTWDSPASRAAFTAGAMAERVPEPIFRPLEKAVCVSGIGGGLTKISPGHKCDLAGRQAQLMRGKRRQRQDLPHPATRIAKTRPVERACSFPGAFQHARFSASRSSGFGVVYCRHGDECARSYPSGACAHHARRQGRSILRSTARCARDPCRPRPVSRLRDQDHER